MDKDDLIEILCTEYSNHIKQEGYFYNNDIWETDVERYVISLSMLETLRDSSDNDKEILLYDELIKEISKDLIKFEGVEAKLS